MYYVGYTDFHLIQNISGIFHEYSKQINKPNIIKETLDAQSRMVKLLGVLTFEGFIFFDMISIHYVC